MQEQDDRSALGSDEPAFEIKGRTPKWRWEFEFTAAGRLLELEKERA